MDRDELDILEGVGYDSDADDDPQGSPSGSEGDGPRASERIQEINRQLAAERAEREKLQRRAEAAESDVLKALGPGGIQWLQTEEGKAFQRQQYGRVWTDDLAGGKPSGDSGKTEPTAPAAPNLTREDLERLAREAGEKAALKAHEKTARETRISNALSEITSKFGAFDSAADEKTVREILERNPSFSAESAYLAAFPDKAAEANVTKQKQQITKQSTGPRGERKTMPKTKPADDDDKYVKVAKRIVKNKDRAARRKLLGNFLIASGGVRSPNMPRD